MDNKHAHIYAYQARNIWCCMLEKALDDVGHSYNNFFTRFLAYMYIYIYIVFLMIEGNIMP